MTIRRALLVGFGAVFSLWLFSVYQFILRVGELEARAAEISVRFAAGEDLLATVKAQALLGAVYVRDAALDQDARIQIYREQLQSTRREIEGALERYVPEINSDFEHEQWVALQKGFQDYWTAAVPLVEGNPRRSAQARELLRQQAEMKNEALLQISDNLRGLHRAAFRQQQREVAALHATLRNWVWWTSGPMVFLGMLIALGSTRYASSLESKIRRQHHDEVQYRNELRDLSARLIRAQEEERHKIVRDLHDEVGQSLTVVKIELAAIERQLDSNSTAVHRRLRDARMVTENTLQSLRDLSQVLRPPMLDDFGLVETLRWYVRSFAERTGLQTSMIADALERMTPDLELCVYRIVQEALTNTAKHADATSCRVQLQRRLDTLLVTIEDDGKGIELSPGAVPSGFGIVGMRERAAGFGGTFHVEHAAAGGTRLVVQLPIATSETERIAIPRVG